jgi:hypothetical protein
VWLVHWQVNNVTVQLPYIGPERLYTIDPTGRFVHFETSFGLIVEFDGTWDLSVSIPKTEYSGVVFGLCGNNDNNTDNDWTTSMGVNVRDQPLAGNLLGDSFVVPDPEITDSL